MRGSRITNPTTLSTTAGFFAAALALGVSAHAADDGQPPALGQPIVLFSHGAVTATPPGFARSVAIPTKHPAAPVQRAPPGGKPLIPPAPLPAKLDPPPEPRPALPLETDLQPLAPSPAPAASSSETAPKAPAS
jgi:hypothetical protein